MVLWHADAASPLRWKETGCTVLTVTSDQLYGQFMFHNIQQHKVVASQTHLPLTFLQIHNKFTPSTYTKSETIKNSAMMQQWYALREKC